MGGLFPQFRHDGSVDETGVRQIAAAQLAIDRVNNKKDGVFDKLLPHTQVCCGQFVLVRYLTHFLLTPYLLLHFCKAQIAGQRHQGTIETSHNTSLPPRETATRLRRIHWTIE